MDILRETENKYQKLLETANDAIFIADAETGIIIDVNKKAEELLSMPAENIKGMHQSQLHTSEESTRYREIFRQHIQSGQAITEPLFVVNKSGHKIPVEISASVTEFGGKKIIQGIFRDITERKKTENALKQSENELRSMYNAITDFLTIISPDYRILRVNRVVEKQYGKDLVDKVCYEVYQARNEICPDCPTKKAVDTKKPAFSFQSATEVSPPVYLNAFPILDDKGEVIAIVEHGKDVTERIKAEEKINNRVVELEKFYQTAVNREVKMKQLKEENEKLKSELSKYKK